jgi:hypothetical protein
VVGGLLEARKENEEWSEQASGGVRTGKDLAETQDLLDEAYEIGKDEKMEMKEIKKDFDGWLNRKNKEVDLVQKRGDHNSTLTVPNKEIAVMFLTELGGQISDGMWENDPKLSSRNMWANYSFARVKVGGDPSIVSNVWGLPKINFKRILTDKGLMGRILSKVRNSVNPEYSAADLKRDIKLLNTYSIKEIID